MDRIEPNHTKFLGPFQSERRWRGRAIPIRGRRQGERYYEDVDQLQRGPIR